MKAQNNYSCIVFKRESLNFGPKHSGNDPADHFVDINKIIEHGKEKSKLD